MQVASARVGSVSLWDRLLGARIHLGWLIVTALGIYVVRLVTIALLPREPIFLGPDEATYAQVTALVASGGEWRDYGLGWGGYLYPGARALLSPAASLAYLGLDPLTSVRMVSATYGLVAMLLLVYLVALVRTPRFGHLPRVIPVMSLAFAAITLIFLMPSRLVWGTLGLRETSSEVFALAALACAATILRLKLTPWQSVVFAAGLFISIVASFQARTLMAVVLSASLVVGLAVSWLRERALSTVLLVVVILAVPVGVASSAGQEAPKASPTSQEVPAAPTLQESVRSGAGVLNPGGLLSRSSAQREVSAVDAESALAVESCSRGSLIGLVGCEFARIPTALPVVLVRPLPILDPWGNLTMAQRAAAIENISWSALILASLIVLVMRRSRFGFVTAVCFVYAASVCVGLALFEGNLGTAFRHKGQLLWVLCLILATAGPWRRSRSDPRSEYQRVSAEGA